MSLFQPRYTSAAGERCKSPTWWIEFRDHLDIRRRVRGFTDKRATETVERKVHELVHARASGTTPSHDLRRWCRTLPPRLRKSLAKWGVIDSRSVAALRPLIEHFEAWRKHLRAKGTSAAQQKQVTGRAARTFKACRMNTLADIAARPIERHLQAQRDEDDGISVRTANAYVQAVKQFTRWALREGLIGEDPLVGLGTLGNPEHDRKLERRALTPLELETLMAATFRGPVRVRLNGPERALLYGLASTTGLRRKEIITLRVGDLDLSDPDRPSIVVQATNTKNGRAARVPLTQPIAVGLARLTAGAEVAAGLMQATCSGVGGAGSPHWSNGICSRLAVLEGRRIAGL